MSDDLLWSNSIETGDVVKIRRTQGWEEQPTTGTQPLPTVLHPNMESIIKISPSSLWYALSEDDKTFILNYNRAIRHSEDKPALPKGVTIGKKQNRAARRVRRAKASDYFDVKPQKEDGNNDDSTIKSKEEENEMEAIEDQRDVIDDSSVGSIGSIEEGNLLLNPDLRKKVTFHLHGANNEVQTKLKTKTKMNYLISKMMLMQMKHARKMTT